MALGSRWYLVDPQPVASRSIGPFLEQSTSLSKRVERLSRGRHIAACAMTIVGDNTGTTHKGVTMAMVERFSVIFSFAVTTITALAAPAMVLAQSDCNVEDLPREAASRGRLVVKVDGAWQYFPPNVDGPPHVLEIGGLQNLCIAWEAPPYHRASRQIVYASTKYRDEQPLWLFRNNAGAGIPFVGSLLGDWNRAPDASGVNPDDAFREFHSSRPDDPFDAPWDNLADWHDTSAWFSNVGSYDLVVGAANDLSALPYGSERLIRLAARRPLTSWVPFTTRAPSGQNELRVAVSYTGDLDSLGPYVYQYVFQVR